MSEVGPTHIFDKRLSENKAGGECNSDVNAKHLEGKGTNALVSLVGEMWFKYLRAWKEGADKYGSIYPELRFSLHDAFLTNPLKGMVKRFLLAKALQKLQEEDDDDRDDDDITKPIKKKLRFNNSVNDRRKEEHRAMNTSDRKSCLFQHSQEISENINHEDDGTNLNSDQANVQYHINQFFILLKGKWGLFLFLMKNVYVQMEMICLLYQR
mmetsp:Transcript_20214/g.28435  ORF Transcript_20214/g.28435 Transcript_20214/m.28435 type:complete len:211 (-) Transcript_20214:712-1344(-)